MTDQWYYRSQSNEFGPYSAGQLRQFALAGRITAKTLVRDGKHADWIPALQVKGLIGTTERPTAPKAPISPPAVPSRPGIAAAIPSDQVQKPLLAPSPVRRKKSGMWIATSLGSAVMIASFLLYVTIARKPKAKEVPPVANTVIEQVSQSKPASPPVVLPKVAPPHTKSSPPQPLPNAESKPEPLRRALTTEEIVAQCESAVALIKGRVSSGTGFLVAPNLLVTNKHVLSDELIDHVKVYFPSAKGNDQGPFKATLAAEDETRDLALIRVESQLKPLKLAPDYHFRRGQEITVIGSPGIGDHVLQNAVSRGVMSTETTIRELPYYQLGISINPGNSGGPVFDSHAEVIGVVTLKAAKQEGLAFCIPAAEVQRLLNQLPSLTRHDVEIMQSNHRLRMAYGSIAFMGKNYRRGMQTYVSAMETAIEHHLYVNTGLSVVQDKVRSELRIYDDVFLDVLRREIHSITSDRNVSDTTRLKLADFWANYLEMKSYVDNPRGSYNTYHAKCNELSDTHERLSESLKALLGLGDGLD